MKDASSAQFQEDASSTQTIRVRVGGVEWDIAHETNVHATSPTPPIYSRNTIEKSISLSDYKRNQEPSGGTAKVSGSDIDGVGIAQQGTNSKGLLWHWFNWLLQILLPNRERRSFVALKGGAILGMMLGCFALCMFHQFTYANGLQRPLVPSKTSTVSASSLPVTVPKFVNVPGFRLYLVSCGTYATATAAQKRVAALASSGISTTIVPLHRYHVVTAMTVSKADADKLASTLGRNATVQILSKHQRAIAVLGTANKRTISVTQAWLSNVQSALLAATAWSNDHGRISDAVTAVQTALSSYPAQASVQDTGIETQLASLKTSIATIQRDLSKSSLDLTSKSCMVAEVKLLELHSIRS